MLQSKPATAQRKRKQILFSCVWLIYALIDMKANLLRFFKEKTRKQIKNRCSVTGSTGSKKLTGRRGFPEAE